MNNVPFAGSIQANVCPDENVKRQKSAKSELLSQAYAELERRVFNVLETYSNVHRGSGHFSSVTTALFEKARTVVLEYLHLPKKDYEVIFCPVSYAEKIKSQLRTDDFHIMSSEELGLPLGLRVLVIKKRSLPKGIPLYTGGSTARMVSSNWIIWAGSPSKFEAGTPMVVNAITFAVALLLRKKYMISNYSSGEISDSLKKLLYEDGFSEFNGLKLISSLQKSMPGKSIQIPTNHGDTIYTNFDNAASTPSFLPVWNIVKDVWRMPMFYRKQIPNEVRKIISEFLSFNLHTHDVIFTANTTESINIASKIIESAFKDEPQPVVLNTLLEHNSNELPWRYLKGFSHVRMQVDGNGVIDTAELGSILSKYNEKKEYGAGKICVVAVSGASNVLGTYNNLKEISKIVHHYGAQLLVDGAQLVAHKEVFLEETGIDYFAFSGHKAYAPFGTGVLVIKRGIIKSRDDDFYLVARQGEENTTGIASLGKALVLLQRIGMKVIEDNEQILVNRLLNGLQSVKGVKVFGITEALTGQRGGIVAFETGRMLHNKLARELAESGGIGVRFGCFCTHMLVKHVLRLPRFFITLQNTVFTLAPKLSGSIPGLMRVSVGIENEVIEVDRFLEVLNRILSREKSAKSPSKNDLSATGIFCSERLQMVYGEMK